jgi:hypothetical protein
VQETERADERGFLVRKVMFLGAAWYEREIEVPSSWKDRVVTLHLERVIWRSEAWIDGQPAGSADSLATPHEHVLGRLAPGRHRVTLRIDNRMQHNLSTLTHAYGPETQSRWNGVVGRLELLARVPVALTRLEIHPAPDRRSVRVVARVSIPEGRQGEGILRFQLEPGTGTRVLARSEQAVRSGPGEARVESVLTLSEPARPWDEFNPVRYRIRGELRTAQGDISEQSEEFGFRQIERDGRSLRVNGRRIFLRGTLDCAVYPDTGHPPMDREAWMRVLGIVKSHGFNHVRYHTWCPPEAAFEAADRLGLYLMPETAAWIDDWTRETLGQPASMGRDPEVSDFLRSELRRIRETYGNHPSFALFCIGNEFGNQGTDWDAVAAWSAEARAGDGRRLFTATTARRSVPGDDFWVTHAVHGKSARGVGPARTDWDFAAAAAATDLPLVAHETGQRPVFPEYRSLLPKFRGPLAPLNYERLRDRLLESGMGDREREFEWASARFQLVQYKAEHEAMRRTAGFAGYQLLMLNDFTGQSEALVGILDPFWESKGVVHTREVRAWNSPTVPLARFARYTWSTAESFRADLDVAHHGPLDLAQARVRWRLTARGGRTVGQGILGPLGLSTGGITRVGSLEVPLSSLDRAAELILRVECDGAGDARNEWSIWAYPAALRTLPASVHVAHGFDADARSVLEQGGKVLLLARGGATNRAARTGFESVYWSAGWWGNEFSGLGIVCRPDHPALAGFPNRGHSDWQWHTLTEGATTFRLDSMPPDYRPIVQVVPDFHFNRLLAQVFEARVGAGRLLVCGYDLQTDLEQRHAARQFRDSLLHYLESPAFRPATEIGFRELARVLGAEEGKGGGKP